jgi:stage V sporulation protein S
MDIIKVAGNSRTSAVAGAIAGVFREYQKAEVQAIGAGAVNQAVKALVLATSYLEKDGYQIAFIPKFLDVDIDGKIRTAIKIFVVHHLGPAAEEAPESELNLPDDAWGDPEASAGH